MSWLRIGLTTLAIIGFHGCTGTIGDPVGGEPVAPAGATQAVVSGARRLTRTEYDDTLRDLLDDQSNSGFALLPEDVNDPFDNDYHTQKVSPALVEAFETLATGAAERAVSTPSVRDAIVPCAPTGPDDAACLAAFTASFGRRALRRPLAQEEIDELVAQLQPFAVEGDDFDLGVKLVIQTLLQDLEFVYRVERGTPVPGAPDVFRLNGFELATRLSYFLVGSTPPDWLLDSAQAGGLDTPEGVRAAADQLMQDDRARARVERFHALWLGFHQLPHAADLVAELRAETAALIDEVVFGADSAEQGYLALFTSEQTYLTDYLAGHYGYEAPAEEGWASYPDERRGILSHGSVLSSFGKFADTSPTQRGIFIRTRLLCGEVPKPPPNVNADEPPSEGECKIDKYAAHSAGGCASCHSLLDPIGFGLERYDNQGRYREHDEGKPECVIAGTGTLEGVRDFAGPAELAELLIESGELEPCIVKQVYRFALGRREDVSDLPILDELGGRFVASGHDFATLLVDLVSSDQFAFRKQEPEEE